METHVGLIAIVAFCIVILIVFVLRKNARDKKELDDFLGTDFRKRHANRESELSNREEA